MSFLEKLTRDEKEIIISLPYRVGWWMSQCEDAGGEDSDAQEEIVLRSIIEGYAREVFGAEIVQHIMTAAVMEKERWTEWGNTPFQSIPNDCRRAMDILRAHTDEEKEAQAFGHHLIEIAEAVAMAFSEYQYTSIFDKIKMHLAYRKEAGKAKKRGERYKSIHEFLSISQKEREVLIQIADALGQNYS